MVQQIVKTLEDLYLLYDEKKKSELLSMSVFQIMKNFVLPNCLCLPRSGIRYPRIDGRFMELMTRHGKDFLEADYELGNVLLECAMQRISKHPALPAIDYQGNLPEGYKSYSAASINCDGHNNCPDEPGLWGFTEVHFIVKMLPTCLKLYNPTLAKHAKLILFQILTLLPNRLTWRDEIFCNFTKEETWNAGLKMLHITPDLEYEFVDYCVCNDWRLAVPIVLRGEFSPETIDYLLSKIDLDKETYYTGFKRRVLKFVGLYNKMTRKRIIEVLQIS